MDGNKKKGLQLSEQGRLTLWMFGLLIIVLIVLAIVQPAFLTQGNLRNVVNQNAVLVIVSMSVTMLMITGNFDLSIGGIIGMGGVLCAWFCQSVPQGGAGLPYGVAFVLSLLACTGIGWLNGFLTMRLGVASVIATLGTMSIARGIAYIGASGSMVELGVPDVFKVVGRQEFGSFLTLPFVIMVIIVIAFFFVETKTVFGQKIYLIGANIKAAQLSGVKVRKQINTLFILSGLLSGLAGIILASKLGAGDCKVGLEYEFNAVVAIILGGTSIAGGRGTVIGTVIGVFIIGMISNTLNLFGASTEWQPIVKGLVIVGAILFQRFAMGFGDRHKLRLEAA
ncbi:MAG: ABC transporter permease [Clostridiales Family XIII bacterium]|jgi:ribose transport system permease protein|nr:ABC transporter permease [Clostridiales Family XIII bacterium]